MKANKLELQPHRCPFPGCTHVVTAFMCAEHWALVPGPNRRTIVAELKVLAARRQRKPSKQLQQAFAEALRQVAREMAKNVDLTS